MYGTHRDLHVLTHSFPTRRSSGLLGMDIGWEATDVAFSLQSLRRLREEGSLGPTTRALAEEAERSGIPVMRLDRQSLIQLGYGKRQHRLRSAERRVGQECVSTCRSWWSPAH